MREEHREPISDRERSRIHRVLQDSARRQQARRKTSGESARPRAAGRAKVLVLQFGVGMLALEALTLFAYNARNPHLTQMEVLRAMPLPSLGAVLVLAVALVCFEIRSCFRERYGRGRTGEEGS